MKTKQLKSRTKRVIYPGLAVLVQKAASTEASLWFEKEKQWKLEERQAIDSAISNEGKGL